MSVPAGVIAMWPGANAAIASLPGWSRVTSLDSRYVKGAAAATEADQTGGAATHTHTSPAHSHSIPSHNHGASTSGAGNQRLHYYDEGTSAWVRGDHTHPVSATSTTGATSGSTVAVWNTASNDPPYVEVIFVVSDGSPDGLPDGAWAWWDDDPLPADWVQPAAAKNRHARGAAAAGDGGGTGGSASHAHTAQSHVHSANHSHTATLSASSNLQSAVNAADTGASPDSHTHTVTVADGQVSSATSGNAGTTAHEPPWTKLAVIENDNGVADLPVGLICAWLGALGSIPPGWVLCDGANGTVDMRGRFPKGADALSEIGDTGGAVGHDHDDPATHTHETAHWHQGVSDAGTLYLFPAQQFPSDTLAAPSHAHGVATAVSGSASSGDGTQTVDATADTQPPFRTVQFIKFVEALDVTIDDPTEDEVVASSIFTVDWSHTGGAPAAQNDYTVEISEVTTFATLVYTSGLVVSATSQHEVPSGYIRNNRTYYIRVTIHDTDNLYGRSATRRITTSWTPPGAPTGFTATAVTEAP